MTELSAILTKSLDSKLRQQIHARVEAMVRQIRYLSEVQDRQMLIVREGGWTPERLEILCVLNSFYQVVLGPLASSAREHRGQLGKAIPILHGTMRFDSQRARAISSAHRSFMYAIREIPESRAVLTATYASDLIFILFREIQNNVNQ